MDSYNNPDNMIPGLCVGQHESSRTVAVTADIVQQAHESNYDMLTTPITTSHFHSRVLTLLSSHLSTMKTATSDYSGTMSTTQNTRPLVIPQLSPADTHLTPNEAMSQLVGLTSPWIDLCSPDPLIADMSRQILMLEVAYAAFCGIGYLLIPGPKLHHGDMHSEGLTYYARTIQDAINMGPYIQFHIWLRSMDQPDMDLDEIGDLGPLARKEFLQASDVEPWPQTDPLGTWDAWDLIRRNCKYHPRLCVALSLPKQLPPISVQSRWHSEPVHLLTIHSAAFIKNQKGYPVLSKAHQALISRFLRLRNPPWLLLCDVGPIPGVGPEGKVDTNKSKLSRSEFPSLSQAASPNKKHHDPTPHLSYVRNLQQRQPPRTAIERFGTGYQDYLQAPLQPLTVNLESITYEVFEKDPVKYEWYERSIAKALKDWSEQKKPTSSPDGRVVVAVVGAGRGPLVSRALQASADTGVPIDLWAVEKNPNAFVLLQRRNETLWDRKVTLVQSDMRSWKGPRREGNASAPPPGPVGESLGIENSLLYAPKSDEKEPAAGKEASPPPADYSYSHIDILISELLGSFGDNELSPECLDGVTNLVNPVHGISIPASYSAHFTPIAAPRLHADVMNQTLTNPAAPETPYVVMLHAIDFLSTNQPTASNIVNKASGSGNGNGNGNDASNIRSSVSPIPNPELPTPFVQSAWSFDHPNKHIPPQQPSTSVVSNAHNVRRTRLTFPCQNRGVCHGLAGYFETVLYRDVELSTNPITMETKSPSMISWFPIYFPLKTPLNVPDNGEIVVTMYRQTDDRKVWYEWMVEVFAVERQTEPAPGPSGIISPVMSGARTVSPGGDNPKNRGPGAAKQGARRFKVGMSELHSSIKEGCLM